MSASLLIFVRVGCESLVQQVDRKSKYLKSSVVAPDQKSLSGLVGILDADVLSELPDKDLSFRLMKLALINNDYEGFGSTRISNRSGSARQWWMLVLWWTTVLLFRMICRKRFLHEFIGRMLDNLQCWMRVNTFGGLECIGTLSN